MLLISFLKPLIFACLFNFGFSFMKAALLKKNTFLSLHMSQSEVVPKIDGEMKAYSFVQDDLRTYAMKLHTKDQAPREGQQKAQTPFTAWEPARKDYLNFLVDSLEVYETIENIVQEIPELSIFKNNGLERASALREDIKWILDFDKSLEAPKCGKSGETYASFLKATVKESIPKFMCHYYNHYFAHTAGGRMIGS